MLKEVGCRYVIIGHSERRQYFGETNETVAKKIRRALDEKLIPIVCVGERLEEREKWKTFEVVKDHLVNGFSLVKKEELHEVVIAYEPVWAIGTGKNATAGQAEEVHSFIRKLLGEMFDKTAAAKVRIQYGGSVNPENIAQLMEEEDVDGALVGGASLTIEGFSQIVKRAHIRVN
jgi:triosephosphate isomerase